MENLRARSRYVDFQKGASFCERRHARAQVCRCVGVWASGRVGVCVCVGVCACACEGTPVARGKEIFPVQLQRREEPAAAAGSAGGAQHLAKARGECVCRHPRDHKRGHRGLRDAQNRQRDARARQRNVVEVLAHVLAPRVAAVVRKPPHGSMQREQGARALRSAGARGSYRPPPNK